VQILEFVNMAKDKQFKVFDPGLGDLGAGLSEAQAGALDAAAAGVQGGLTDLERKIAAGDDAAKMIPDAVALLEQAMAIVRMLVGVPSAGVAAAEPKEG
jgi:hypothetical protein